MTLSAIILPTMTLPTTLPSASLFAAGRTLRLADPLWLLAAVPFLAVLVWCTKRRGRQAVLFPAVGLLRSIRPTIRQRLLVLVPILFGAGGLAAIIALARPQAGEEDYRVRSEGIDMILCLDRSGSMAAMDFTMDRKRVDRFTVVKQIFRDFILGSDRYSGRPDDRVGLITFGGYVDSLCPLTLDHEALAETLEMVNLPEPLRDAHGRIISNDILDEESATAIGDALVTAVERLETSRARSRVVVLLSDGKQNTGAVSAEEAAAIAKKKGIRVYTIGIGSTGVAPFPQYGPDGPKVLVNQPVELDERALKQIASATGAEYFNARSSGALDEICRKIDELEKTEHTERVFTRYRELYFPWLAWGAALIGLASVLNLTWLKTTPQ